MKLDEKVKTALLKSPTWRIVIGGEYWLCPFCGEAKVLWGEDKLKLVERICRHIGGTCKGYKMRRERELNPAALEERRVFCELERRVSREELWQVADGSERWYCPHCGEPTAVRFRKVMDRVPTQVVTEIAMHLKSCRAANSPTVPLQTLRQRAGVHDRYGKVRELALMGVQVAPDVWAVFDATNHWVCPYCMEATVTVPQGAELPPNELVEKIGAHLIACPRFTEAPPSVSKEEMKRQVVQLNDKQEALAVIRRDQAAVIPKQHPKVPGFDIHTEWVPANVVGGDFFRYVDVLGGSVGVLLGDVSGHAAHGSIITQIIQAFVEHAPRTTSPSEALISVCQSMSRAGMRQGTFVSMVYTVLDPNEKTLALARAGHDFPLLVNEARKPPAFLIKGNGMALGMGPPEVFANALKDVRLPLHPGDVLLLYTDGITETCSPSRVPFGIEGLTRVVRASASLPAAEIARRAVEAAKKHRGSGFQEDDICLSVIKFTG